MRTALLTILTLFGSGCTLQPSARTTTTETSEPAIVEMPVQTKLVETRYEVRGYTETSNPSLRHDAHAIFRKTRVPVVVTVDAQTVPRTGYPAASIATLPASDELAAELATQKATTAEIQAMQKSIAEIEKRMRVQYGQLVRQSAEALQLQKKLEEDRRTEKNTQTPSPTPTSPVATIADTPVVKW